MITTQMLPQTTAPIQGILAQDVFILTGANTAVVRSKHGGAYGLHFSDRQGRYAVTECECRGSEIRNTCRHRKELAVVLDVPALAASGQPVPYLHALAAATALAFWPGTSIRRIETSSQKCPCGQPLTCVLGHGTFDLQDAPAHLVKRVCENCGVQA